VVLAMRAHARPQPERSAAASVRLHLVDSRREDTDPVTYLAHLSPDATSIEKRPEPGDPVDAEITATTRDWKACIIGGVAHDAMADIVVTGDNEAAKALLKATSLSEAH
jgi:hypothetical protein